MNSSSSRFETYGAKLAALLGSASLFTLAGAVAAQAQQAAPQAVEQVPEQVLITGSLIHGTAAVGVPVTNLSPQDFAQTGALTTADLFRTVPAATVSPGAVATQSGANIERATRVNLRGLDTGNASRSLLMVDGMRVPPQGNGLCELDPSIIPALSLDRIDILVDGASATYGSDAVGGVINIILKRGYDGAVSQVRYTTAPGGGNQYLASQLWGRTWDGGDITLSYEWYDHSPIKGNEHSNFTLNYSPWGLPNRIPLASSIPGTLSIGAPAGFSSVVAANLGTNCSNCVAIPRGYGANYAPGAGGFGPAANTPGVFNAPGFDFNAINTAANNGTNGTRNEVDPLSLGWFDAAQQRNGGAITVDQRLTKDITFYGEGFYSNRRAQFLSPSNETPSSSNDLSIAIPTVNPYYPTNAPSNLRVNINMGAPGMSPSMTSAYEVADRYQGGFKIKLPGDWNADIYYSDTYDSSYNVVRGTINPSAVSAALGWTVGATAPSGTTPGISTYAKPGAIPYLNLFCDPTQFTCNSAATLGYIQGIRSFNEKFWDNEKGAKFDGPLFDLPGGTVKMAVGATYTSQHFNTVTLDNTAQSSLVIPYLQDTESRAVWAVFGQLNVPIFEDVNAIPLFKKLELELSWRHDQYSDVGGTSNPKIAFNWQPIDDLTVRGDWGTSFRAPQFGETSPLANVTFQGFGLPAAFAPPPGTNIDIVCSGGNAPVAGSAAARFVANDGGAGNCPTQFTTASGNGIPGISILGGSAGSVNAGLRSIGPNAGTGQLKPEQSTNWGIGGDYAPSTGFLKGLDLAATYYIVKINGVLANFGNPTDSLFNDPTKGFAFLVASDLCPGANNLNPSTCAAFESMVQGLIANPRSVVTPGATSSILFINDGGTFNKGWIKVSGIDFNASYDWEMGDFGAWSTGITGTYYLHSYQNATPGAPGSTVTDYFHTLIGAGPNMVGVESAPRLRYRGRLGWSNGPWSVTGFVDYQSHFFQTQSFPANVNSNVCNAAGGVGNGTSDTFACPIQNYTDYEPSMYTFDLSLGYDTGDNPANDYLKHIGVQLVVQNLFDKLPAFEYRIQTTGGNPAAYDILKSDTGRTISLILTKTW